jgi:UDP-GlcNAc:undecaprenyl-phosphate/decaprenyl-phosphate GlcNAc-1-phosphate transferase
VIACLVPAEIPGYLGAAAAGSIAVVLLIWLLRSEWTANVLRAVFYLTVPLILWIGQTGPAAWTEGPLMQVFRLAPGVLAMFTVLTLKLTRRKKGFKPTPMDFLIILIALVVPNLPEPAIRSAGMGALAATIIVMFFGLEVLLGELRGDIRKLLVGVGAALAVLAVRSVV